MIRNFLQGLNLRSRPKRRVSRSRRTWGLENLEGRVLLANNPTLYTVDLTSDTGTGTGNAGDLLFVIGQANANPNPAGSLIQFSTPLFSTPQTIMLGSTLELSGSAGPITIDGPGATLLTVNGNNTVRVFSVDAGVTAAFSGLTISSGLASAGAGIANSGVLALSACAITNNVANGPSAEGGGIENNRMLTISNCTISNNSISTTNGSGGGIFSDDTLAITGSTIANNSTGDGGLGGGVFNTFTATLTGDTIANNSVGSGGNGGGLFNDGQMLVSGCTIASNSTGSGDGGGIYNVGLLTLPDSTVAGNSAGGDGGGIFNGLTLTAVNTTIAYNSAAIGGTGGGLDASAGTSTLDNTIVAQNTHLIVSGSVPDDIAGTVSSASKFDLIGTGGPGGLTNGVNGNQVGVANPVLGPLANNGGAAPTIALLPGSPAINAGSNALNGLEFDERGPGFPRSFNGSIDIGAFEAQPAVITAVSVTWGNAGSAPLLTAADGLRLLPPGRHTDIPWFGISKLQLILNQPSTLTSPDVAIQSLKNVIYGPVTVTGSGTSYAIILLRPIVVADRVTITIASPGNTGIATYTRRLDIQPADVNDDGVVNRVDARIVRSQLREAITLANIFADIVGDTTIDGADLQLVKRRNGGKLPKLPSSTPQAALARSLARQHVRTMRPKP
jgi:hypothetical protein